MSLFDDLLADQVAALWNWRGATDDEVHSDGIAIAAAVQQLVGQPVDTVHDLARLARLHQVVYEPGGEAGIEKALYGAMVRGAIVLAA